MKTEGTGERIGAYRVVRRIATGGTSDVLLAKAEGPHGFERTVVLKLLLSQYREDGDFTRMFAREASAYARLSNPAIVQLHDFFSTEAPRRGPGAPEEQLVMVLEYVDGPTLHRLRGMLKTVGQTLDDQASFYVAMRIYEALAAAHAATEDGAPAPVIHRDVNPSNVLVSWDGEVKLADFGVAKVTGLTHQSVAGLIKGTYGYMAPEQVTGEPVTTRADVYSAAIILWELLAKRKAFQRGALPEVEVLRQMAEPRIAALDELRPDVDKAVRDVLRTALSPEAAVRSVSALDILAVLRAAVTPEIGRQRLQAALARVRHEPKTSGEMNAVGAPVLRRPEPPPKVSIPPRPNLSKPPPLHRSVASSAKRKTIAFGATSPAKPVVSPAPETIPPNPVFDSYVEPPELVAATGRPSERARMPSQIESFTTGLSVGQAIDEILKGAPVLPTPKNLVEEIGLRRTIDQGRETLDNEETAKLPKAPPPLSATVPLGRTSPTADADVAPLDEDVPTVVPSPSTTLATPLEPTPAVDFPAMDRTLMLGARPPPTPSELPFDATNAVQPSPFLPAGAQPTPEPASPQISTVSTVPPARQDEPQRRKKSSVLVVFPLLFLAIGLGVGGTFGYGRWKKSRAHTHNGPVATEAASASAAAPTSPPGPASGAAAAASASAPAASASASGSAPASVSAPVPDAAAPVADAGAAATMGIPEGMGILRTANAPAGRRIFVDDKVVGQTPDNPTVKCGSHSVKIGSAGKPQTIDIPCGGEIVVNF